MSDPLILAVETATRSGSIALAKGEEVVASQAGDAAVSHSAHLIEMIESALREAGVQLSDVDLFAAAVGPGSFTGLRIGLATVKALATCTERKVVGVNTLEAIAHASRASGRVVSMLPAGRGEVFAQLFLVKNGTPQSLDEAAHLPPRALLEKYGKQSPLCWAGDGAHQQADTLSTWARDNNLQFNEGESTSGWRVVPEANSLAASVASIALTDYREGNSTSPQELHASYVRASDAEINERWQHEKASR